MDVIKNNPVSDQDLTSLNNEIQRIKPIVATKQSYEMLSTREKGLWKSICRAFSNLFQNRTSSKEVIDAIKTRTDNPNDAAHLLPADQRDWLDKRLFALIADLPCREIADFTYINEIPDLVAQDPISILYQKDGGTYLGLKLNAVHTPSTNSSQQDPFSFDMLIRLDGRMHVWTAAKTEGRDIAIDVGLRYLNGFNGSIDKIKLTSELEEVFWGNSHHDATEMIENHCHYDPRWLVSRLSNGDTVYIRDVPKVFYYDVSDSQCENVGYWELSLTT